jgi:hypothetical protein
VVVQILLIRIYPTFNPTQLQNYDGDVIIQMILNSNTTNFEYTLLNENILRYTKTFNKVHNFARY